ncbi:MAG: hypothetical protein AB1429_00255 [Pseudomonadota bacterium]
MASKPNKSDRESRLAEALRANLRRRKASKTTPAAYDKTSEEVVETPAATASTQK